MFGTIYSIGGLAVCCVLLVLAIWRGGPSEQAGAGLITLTWAASAVAEFLLHRSYARWLPAVDVALLVGLAVLTWRSRREWPLVTLAFQGVVVAVEVAYLLDVAIPHPIYVTAVAVSSFGVLASVAFGVWQALTRTRTPPATS